MTSFAEPLSGAAVNYLIEEASGLSNSWHDFGSKINMEILLIEDEVVVAKFMADALSSQGHKTTVAHSGEEGLTYLSQHRPDAVFLDVRLPGMNEIAVLRRIRETAAKLPVILITGHSRPDQIEEARRLGVAGVIEKSFVLTNLSEILGCLS